MAERAKGPQANPEEEYFEPLLDRGKMKDALRFEPNRDKRKEILHEHYDQALERAMGSVEDTITQRQEQGEEIIYQDILDKAYDELGEKTHSYPKTKESYLRMV